MKALRASLIGLLVGSLLSPGAFAQRGMSGSSPGVDAELTKIFAAFKGFSADAEITTPSPQGEITMVTSYEMLDGKVRMEIDMAAMRGPAMPPEMISQLKTMGMDHIINIIMPAQWQICIIYPGLKSYVEMPIPGNPPAVNAGPESTPTYSEVAKETLDAHPCVKSKWTFVGKDGRKLEGFVWTATDLKNFPIQVQVDNARGSTTMRFKNVQLKEPSADRFTPPAGFTKHANMQEMMQAAAANMMGGRMPSAR